MKKHIKYPKIEQFRNVVANINRMVSFVGLDENGAAVLDHTIPKPVLTFKGTVKLHGTNASVCYNVANGMWFQSRKNIITVENDNAGFVAFAENKKEVFMNLIREIMLTHKIDTNEFTISIYGEWVGKGIQKGVGISHIEKAFFIFGVKISKPQNKDVKSFWVSFKNLKNKENRIFNIEDYKTFEVAVDFNMPQLAQNKFAEITLQVEKECPVAKEFGIKNGIGEGVVWTVNYKNVNHRFKVKGAKHSVTKVKKLANVDIEKLNSINEFISYAVTKNRFIQAKENVFGDDDIDIKKMGDLIRWIVNDIASEEMDTMKANNLVAKDVNKYISNETRKMFFEEMKCL